MRRVRDTSSSSGQCRNFEWLALDVRLSLDLERGKECPRGRYSSDTQTYPSRRASSCAILSSYTHRGKNLTILPRLKNGMVNGFGSLAMLFAFTSISTVPHLVDNLRGGLAVLMPASPTFLGVIYSVVAQAILATPVLLSVLYGGAWYTAKKNRESSRFWALTASAAILLQSLPVSLAAYYAWAKSNQPVLMKFLMIDALLILPGAFGLLLFLPASERLVSRVRTRVVGDGTGPILEATAWVVEAGGYLGGQYLCLKWGQSAHLSL